MHYLIIADYIGENWRGYALWAGFALLASAAIYLIRSRRIAKGWKRIILRASGGILLTIVGLSSCVFLLGTLMASATREHIVFTSLTGDRVAMLSHSSYRDFSTTQVAVKADGCCRRYIAYDYHGDGNDYMGADSVSWIDDHKLLIRYAKDVSGMQVCLPRVGDIFVVCENRAAPAFPINDPR